MRFHPLGVTGYVSLNDVGVLLRFDGRSFNVNSEVTQRRAHHYKCAVLGTHPTIGACEMIKVAFVCCCLLLTLPACTETQEGANNESPTGTHSARDLEGRRQEIAELISFYRLIARAEDYEGKTISTFGYLEVSEVNNSAYLYPTTDALNHAIIVDKLVLALPEELWLKVKDLNSRYVTVSGVFHSAEGRTGEYIEFGRLDPVIRLIDMQRD
jgi:hypothetical protein